ncbi:MAG: glycosyltransferase family 4 protein [Terriglobia bacterium]
MKILYIAQYFPPEVCALAVRAHDLSQEWARAGHEVSVLTGFPNHPEGVIHPSYRRAWRRGFSREERGGVAVYRTWLYPAANRGVWGRSANYVSFALSAALVGMRAAGERTVVIATSPPLTAALAGYAAARARGVPFVFEVRDLWPESLEAVGVASPRSFLYRSLERAARFLYARADRIVVDGEWKQRALAASGFGEKITVIRNGVAENFCLAPGSPQARAAREQFRSAHGLAGKFVALYCGTLGMAHGLEVVLDAAARLRDRAEIVFLLAGGGAERENICRRLRESGLTSVRYLGKQPRENVPGLLAAADACLVPLRSSEVFKSAIPSKTFEAMAAARPVILGVEGETKEIVLEAGAGLCVAPGDAEALASAVIRLQQNPDLRRKLGANGRRAVLATYTRRRQASAYVDLLNELAAARLERLPASPLAARRPISAQPLGE